MQRGQIPNGWTLQPNHAPAAVDAKALKLVAADNEMSVMVDQYGAQRGVTVAMFGNGLELEVADGETCGSVLRLKSGDNELMIVLTAATLDQFQTALEMARDERVTAS